MAATLLTTVIRESTTAIYSAKVTDENGNAIDVSQITAFTLSYYNVDTGAIINSRQDQNALNANNVTVVTAGSPSVTTLTWTIQPLDSVLVDARKGKERHEAIFRWTYSGGRKGVHFIAFDIENLLF